MASKNNSNGVIILLVIIIVGAILAVVLLNHKNSNLTPAEQTVDKSQITTNWEEFFAASTSQAERENLLQNGKQFASVIKSEFQALGAAKSSVKVTSISLTNKTEAKVTYAVYLNGASVLPSESGTALSENGAWVVSDSTLCGLLALDGSKPAVCSNT